MVILPPGRMISEKMFELGIDSAELAKRMEVSLETVEQLIRYEIVLTEDLAERLERATWMDARFMLRLESTWRSDIEYAMQHPEKPAYLGGKIINKPKKDGNKRPLKEPRREPVKSIDEKANKNNASTLILSSPVWSCNQAKDTIRNNKAEK